MNVRGCGWKSVSGQHVQHIAHVCCKHDYCTSALQLCSLDFPTTSIAVPLGSAGHTCSYSTLVGNMFQFLYGMPPQQETVFLLKLFNGSFSAGCGVLSTAATLCFASKLSGMCQSSRDCNPVTTWTGCNERLPLCRLVKPRGC